MSVGASITREVPGSVQNAIGAAALIVIGLVTLVRRTRGTPEAARTGPWRPLLNDSLVTRVRSVPAGERGLPRRGRRARRGTVTQQPRDRGRCGVTGVLTLLVTLDATVFSFVFVALASRVGRRVSGRSSAAFSSLASTLPPSWPADRGACWSRRAVAPGSTSSRGAIMARRGPAVRRGGGRRLGAEKTRCSIAPGRRRSRRNASSRAARRRSVGRSSSANSSPTCARCTAGRPHLLARPDRLLLGRGRHSARHLDEPALIAEHAGVSVLSDVRNRDDAAGGHGAPLASLIDVLLLGENGPVRGWLNLGGIANVTALGGEGPDRLRRRSGERPDRRRRACGRWRGPCGARLLRAVLSQFNLCSWSPDATCIPTQESSGWPGTSLSSVSCSVASISSGAAGPLHRSRYRRRVPPARCRGLVSRHGGTTLDAQAAVSRATKTAHGRMRTGSRGSRGCGGLFLGSDLVTVAVLTLRGARGALTRPPRAARPLGTRQEHPSQSVRPPKRILAPG